MAKSEIIEKLDSQMLRDEFGECEVVYLMVEFRKLLELSKKKDEYYILKFYCDWIVHTEKDRIPEPVKGFFDEVNSSVTEENKYYQHKIDRFFTCEELKKELLAFFSEFQINPEIIIETNKWISFSSTLIRILINQPINNPHKDIRKIFFEKDDEPDVLRFAIMFNDKRHTWLFRTRWKI